MNEENKYKGAIDYFGEIIVHRYFQLISDDVEVEYLFLNDEEIRIATPQLISKYRQAFKDSLQPIKTANYDYLSTVGYIANKVQAESSWDNKMTWLVSYLFDVFKTPTMEYFSTDIKMQDVWDLDYTEIAEIFKAPYLVHILDISIKASLYFTLDMDKEESQIKQSVFPKELDSQQFRNILQRAINGGVVACLNGLYTWKGSKRELAYFAASYNIKIWKKDEGKRGDKEKRFQFAWKPFESFFNKRNISQEYTDIAFEETEYPRIKALFKVD